MKLGETLGYALKEEITNTNRAKEGDMLFLKSSIITMYFEDLINHNDIKKVRDLLSAYKYGVIETDFILAETLAIIANALKNKIKFDDFEEMLSKLNEIEMKYPWVLSMCNKLFELIPEVVVLCDKVFFMKHDTNSILSRFCYINLEEIQQEVIRYEQLDDSGFVVDVSSNYKKMYGYNSKKKVIYLEPAALDDVYVEYYVETHQEKVIHNKCEGMISDLLLIETEGCLAYKKDEEVNVIKTISEFERYTIDGNHIYVTPSLLQPSVFKPYWLSVNGIVIPTSYQGAANYIWNLMKPYKSPFVEKVIESGINTEGWSLAEKNPFNLKSLKEYFYTLGCPEVNKESRLYLFLITTLSKYIDTEVDVLDYFYLILDVSRKYEQYFMKATLSERLLIHIEELDVSGRLNECIHDLTKLRDVLMEKAYWTSERLEKRFDRNPNKQQVGYFDIKGDDIYTVAISVHDGVFVGNLVMMPGERQRGIVAYDVNRDAFVIQYTRLMTEDEIEEIADTYNIENEMLQIIVEERI